MPPEVKQIANLATDYIKHWTSRELTRLQNERTPVCIPTATGYKIGNYNLFVNKNRTCEVRNHYNEFIHTFDNKVSAIIYTVYIIKNKLNAADEILRLDQEINKNYIDVLAMKRSQDRARTKKDYDIVDIRQARLDEAQKQLEIARDKLSKIHLHAKYNKVWE